MHSAFHGLSVIGSKHTLFKFKWINHHVIFGGPLSERAVLTRSTLKTLRAVSTSWRMKKRREEKSWKVTKMVKNEWKDLVCGTVTSSSEKKQTKFLDFFLNCASDNRSSGHTLQFFANSQRSEYKVALCRINTWLWRHKKTCTCLWGIQYSRIGAWSWYYAYLSWVPLDFSYPDHFS